MTNITPPKNQILWVRYVTNEVVTHIITSDSYRLTYYLYQVTNNKLTKLKQSNDPQKLDEYLEKTKMK